MLKIYGNRDYLTETSTIEGYHWFMDMYDHTPLYIEENYDLKRFDVPAHIRYILLVESDGWVFMAISIPESERVVAVAQGRCDTIWNTDGIAFIEHVDKDGETLRQWALENSPYEVSRKDLEDEGIDVDELMDSMCWPTGATLENSVMIQQL